jgi:molybdopterin synthase sulfur carrier subunit
VTVNFYATLRRIVGQRSVELPIPDGAPVGELVGELARRWPALAEHLFDESGGLSRRVNLFVGGRNVRWLHGLATPLRDDQVVDVFPPVAGG